MQAARYALRQPAWLSGEVISRMAERSGAAAAEALVVAIYHRFIIFEPLFLEFGAGAGVDALGLTYLTAKFATSAPAAGRPQRGMLASYPFDGQGRVQTRFFSDQESPDPIPDRNEVGFPVSVHARAGSRVQVQQFQIRPQGGAPLEVRLLAAGLDPHTPESVAAIVPLQTLAPATRYEVQFTGTIDAAAVSRHWSFMTE